MRKPLLFFILFLTSFHTFSQNNEDRQEIIAKLKKQWEKKKVQPALEVNVPDSLPEITFNVADLESGGPTVHMYFFPNKFDKSQVKMYFYTSESNTRQGVGLTSYYREGNTIFNMGFLYPYTFKAQKLPQFTGKFKMRANMGGTFLIYLSSKGGKFGKEIFFNQ